MEINQQLNTQDTQEERQSIKQRKTKQKRQRMSTENDKEAVAHTQANSGNMQRRGCTNNNERGRGDMRTQNGRGGNQMRGNERGNSGRGAQTCGTKPPRGNPPPRGGTNNNFNNNNVNHSPNNHANRGASNEANHGLSHEISSPRSLNTIDPSLLEVDIDSALPPPPPPQQLSPVSSKNREEGPSRASFTLAVKRSSPVVSNTIISKSRVKSHVDRLLVEEDDGNYRNTMSPTLPDRVLKIIQSAKVASINLNSASDQGRSQSCNIHSGNDPLNINNNNNNSNQEGSRGSAPVVRKVSNQLTANQPATLRVMIPEHSTVCQVEVNSKMVVDDLLDALIHILQHEHLIELKGLHEQAAKEYFGLYLPNQNVWCRKEKRLEDYSIVTLVFIFFVFFIFSFGDSF